MLEKISDVFEDYRLEPLRFEGSGDRVAVLFREVGRGRTSGMEVDRRTILLYTAAEGKVSRIDSFLDRRRDLREVVEHP